MRVDDRLHLGTVLKEKLVRIIGVVKCLWRSAVRFLVVTNAFGSNYKKKFHFANNVLANTRGKVVFFIY